MTLDLDRIYALIPAVYRIRDADIAAKSDLLDPDEAAELAGLLSISGPLTAVQGRRLQELQDKRQRGPLRAMVSLLAEQVEALQASLEQAYDDQFIETCQEWVVPYIGDLVAARNISVFPGAPFSQRGLVADTLRNRKRKGTVSVIESLARDVTNWDVNVVEYFQVLATTQYMNHIRRGNLATAPVRGADRLLLNTPFDPYAHNVDVRNIASRRGKYNIPNIGIFLWRIPSNPLDDSPAFRLDARRYLFDALGRDTPLFTFAEPENETTGRATPFNVPIPIRRRIMADRLSAYYGIGPGRQQRSVRLVVDGVDSPPVSICDLSDVKDQFGNVTGWAHQPKNTIAVDPELGRIAFPEPPVAAPGSVRVSYFYGFSAPIGGGQYERELSTDYDVFIRVPDDVPGIGPALSSAAAQLTGLKKKAVVEVQDNNYYIETPSVAVPAGAGIELRSATQKRPVLVLDGDFVVTGGEGSAFRVDGLLVSGGAISVPAMISSPEPNELRSLEIAHCTLAPGAAPAIGSRAAQLAGPRLWIEAADVTVTLDKSITGSIRASDRCDFSIANSAVDALDRGEVAYAGLSSVDAGGPLTIRNTTVIGKTHTLRIDLASNVIFAAERAPSDPGAPPVQAEQVQQGCVRFSFVPEGSHVPRRFRCHPDPADTRPVSPAFTSTRFGDPGYLQLAAQSGPEILEGADDESEMGVFHDLFQPQRKQNLSAALPEFLRFALEAGIFDAS